MTLRATPRVMRLTPALMQARLSDAMDVYLTAMNYGPEWRVLRRDPWEQSILNPEWTAYAAFATHFPQNPLQPPDPLHDTLVGITFGYRGDPRSWWSDKIRQGLERVDYSPASVSALMDNYYELSELHVLPAYQGRGLGRELLSNMLRASAGHHMLLSTPEVPQERNAAWQLYRAMGFRDLLRDFTFPGDQRTFGILVHSAAPE
ncbi:GNAT family N-acetyltransferase [Lawsonella clevelandensis]|uniref:N-alpha-acetyltransferase RimI n=1 Tax=Lawsonella clevelandensis TaxID=1528099 RepID=A0A0M3TBT1_9ACTN|nr:GNAT family N-acetyltransferase [Lawsonella clevelandensis]ALE19430.1 hypothetical protein AL705_07720 [Lawsonella clevelandensis]ALE35104.1 hypothetical protein IY73_07675 [Lawsonella clevelandensis]MDU7194096.1 GNAT family N-acetyltransferase [Lawsonella clevelandensis]VHO01622.1 N-alpha-acetyltransferase RimI [Lawsonella clevelandensis]